MLNARMSKSFFMGFPPQEFCAGAETPGLGLFSQQDAFHDHVEDRRGDVCRRNEPGQNPSVRKILREIGRAIKHPQGIQHLSGLWNDGSIREGCRSCGSVSRDNSDVGFVDNHLRRDGQILISVATYKTSGHLRGVDSFLEDTVIPYSMRRDCTDYFGS